MVDERHKGSSQRDASAENRVYFYATVAARDPFGPSLKGVVFNGIISQIGSNCDWPTLIDFEITNSPLSISS